MFTSASIAAAIVVAISSSTAASAVVTSCVTPTSVTSSVVVTTAAAAAKVSGRSEGFAVELLLSFPVGSPEVALGPFEGLAGDVVEERLCFVVEGTVFVSVLIFSVNFTVFDFVVNFFRCGCRLVNVAFAVSARLVLVGAFKICFLKIRNKNRLSI